MRSTSSNAQLSVGFETVADLELLRTLDELGQPVVSVANRDNWGTAMSISRDDEYTARGSHLRTERAMQR